jgi:hypothetical protein
MVNHRGGGLPPLLLGQQAFFLYTRTHMYYW